MRLLVLLTVLHAIFQSESAAPKSVTNEDIRNAILTLVHKARSTEEKLERHELRERALGEQLKTTLVPIDKRTKILDFIKGAISKLDGRLANLEAAITRIEAKHKTQAEKTQELSSDVKNFPSIIDKLKTDLINEIKANKVQIPKPQPTVSKEDISDIEKNLSSKIDAISTTVQKVQKELETLKEKHDSAQQLNNQTKEHVENVKIHLTNSEELLEKFEAKLAKYKNEIEILPQNLTQAMGKQKTDVEKILTEVKMISGKVKTLPDKNELKASQSPTIKAIDNLKGTTNGNTYHTKKLIEDKAKAILEKINRIVIPKPSISKEDVNNVQKALSSKMDSLTLTTQKMQNDTKRLVEENSNAILEKVNKIVIPKPAISKEDLNDVQKVLSNKVDSISMSNQKIQNDLSTLKNEHQNAQNINQQTIEHIKDFKVYLNNSEGVLKKFEAKLAKYNSTFDVLPRNITEALEKQTDAVERVQMKVQTVLTKIKTLPEKDDLKKMQNQTLNSIGDLKSNLNENINDSRKSVENKVMDILEVVNKIPKNDIYEIQKNLSIKIESLNSSILNVQEKVSQIKSDHENVQNINTQTSEQMKTVKLHFNNNERLLEKYESKLARYSDNIEILQQNDKAENGWHSSMMEVLEKQKIDVENLLGEIRNVSKMIKEIPVKDDLKETQNRTLESIEKLKIDISDKISETDQSTSESASKEEVQNTLLDKIEMVAISIRKIQTGLTKLEGEHLKAQKLNEQSSEHVEKVKLHLDNAEELLQRYKATLAEYENKTEILLQNIDTNNNCCTNVTRVLERQKQDVEKILAQIKKVSGRIDTLPNKDQMETSKTEVFKLIENLKINVNQSTNDTKMLIEDRVKVILKTVEAVGSNNTKSSSEIGDMIEVLTMNLATSHQALLDEVNSLRNLEQVMLQTSDGVMDTKRRVEYGVQQILLEIGDLVKAHSKKINATINERFSKFESSIMNEVNNVFTNVTSKINDEIDQVWRQIGSLHQQMAQSTDTLNRLQNETDVYVNGSLNVMNGMKAKITKITERMTEIDNNLNYLMGKLTLISTEFKEMKTGLDDALNEIKHTSQGLHNNVTDTPYGTHETTVDNEVTVDT